VVRGFRRLRRRLFTSPLDAFFDRVRGALCSVPLQLTAGSANTTATLDRARAPTSSLIKLSALRIDFKGHGGKETGGWPPRPIAEMRFVLELGWRRVHERRAGGQATKVREVTISAAHLNARQLLEWSQDDVASANGFDKEALLHFDDRAHSPT
jgi:hypothetical protein